ncbi:RNA polymerase II associated protein 1 [Chytridiales sp. JEL 0842]|nr:RNA polymerase II associated protein 1 [Chytridiales sp. JEL 0842]
MADKPRKSLFAARLARDRAAQAAVAPAPGAVVPSRGQGADSSGPNVPKPDKHAKFSVPLNTGGSILADVSESKVGTVEPPKPTQARGFPLVERIASLEEAMASIHHDQLSESSSTVDFNPMETELSQTQAEIHEQNMAKLMSMSSDEIAQAQEEILTTFSSSLMESIKARAAKKYSKSTSSESSASRNPETTTTKPLISAIPFEPKIDPSAYQAAEDLECSKLEWTLPVTAADNQIDTAGDNTSLRFDLHGFVIADGSSIPTYLGLHHHGDEPSRAGYTISELSILTRSTVAAQRAVGIKALTAIIRRLRQGAFDKDVENSIFRALDKAHTLAYFRISLDDSNLNVISAGLTALAVCLGCEVLTSSPAVTNTESLLMSSGIKGLYLGLESLRRLRNNAAGYYQRDSESDVPNNNLFDERTEFVSIEDVTMAFTSDMVAALKKSLLLERLRYFLKSRMLPLSDSCQILNILACAANHSEYISIAIATMSELVKLTRSMFLDIQWPSASPIQAQAAKCAINLISQLSLCSKEITRGFMEADVVDSITKFISLPLDTTADDGSKDMIWDLQASSLRMLSLFFSYGISPRLFHEYRGSLTDYALTSVRYYKQSIPAKRISASLDNLFSNFWRVLRSLIEGFPDEMGIGQFDDYMLPFAPLSLQLLKLFFSGENATVIPNSLISEVIAFLTIYLNRVVPRSSAALTLANDLTNALDDISAGLQQYFTILTQNLKARLPLRETSNVQLRIFGMGLPASLKLSNDAVEVGQLADTIATLLDLRSALKRLSIGNYVVLNPLISAAMEISSLHTFDRAHEIHVAVHCLARGIEKMRIAVVRDFIVEKDVLDAAESKALLTIVLHHVGGSSEVDVSLLLKVFNRTVLGGQNVSSNHAKLIAFYEDYVFGDVSDDADRKDKGANLRAVSIPVDWIFAPLYYIRKASDNGVTFRESRDLLQLCLALICNVSEVVPLVDILSPALAFVHLMGVFTMPALQGGQEIFQVDSIRASLSSLLKALTPNKHPIQDLEAACGTSAKFYKLYQDFLGQFTSVSMGDTLFAQYAVVPLVMTCPPDFRALFWTEVVEAMPSLWLSMEDLVVDFKYYVEPFETRENIISSQLRFLMREAAGREGNALYRIAKETALNHVSTVDKLGDVRKFFATTGEIAADISSSFAPAHQLGRGAASSGMPSVAAASGGHANLPPSLATTHHMATTLTSNPSAEMAALDDVLEGISVHYAVHLISILGHYSEDIRVQAVFLLVDLATIFEKSSNDLKKHLGKITLGFQSDDRALTRIVYENEKVFLEEDHLAAIWNLYFSLGSIPLISKVFPDRCVIIKSLGTLAPLYSLADISLTYGVIGTLLRLKDKTALETEAIKSALKKIFEKLSDKGKNVTDKDLAKSAFTAGSGTGFNLFLNLLSPSDEYSYDLMSWALETYALAVGKSDEKKRATTINDFPPLSEFIKSLSNHFRATPSLVRYGSCICLHAALTVCPELIKVNKGLYVYILSGILDTDYLSSFLYTSMLEDIATASGNEEIKRMIGQLRHKDVNATDNVRAITPNSRKLRKDITISDLLDVAVKAAPPIAPKMLHKLVNSLEYLSKSAKIRQMELIRLWGSKSEKFDTYLMQALVPLLNSPDDEIQLATVKVLKSLIPLFKTALPGDIHFAWTYFHSHLSSSTNGSMLEAILDLVKLFPLERLPQPDREELLSTLLKLTLHKEPSVRLSAYNSIGGSTEFWKASSLFNSALGVLFLALGDQDVENAKRAIDLLCKNLQSTPYSKSLLVPLGLLKDAIGGPLALVAKAHDDLANAILKERAELKDLVDAMIHDSAVDEYWNFFLEDTPENQLKCLSGFDILKLIVRLKLPGVSPSILLQYLDMALDVAFNAPSSVVKVGALELIEAFLLVFPGGVSTKLAEVRDVVRTLMVDKEADVLETASRIYPLVFRCVSSNNTKEFFDYLKNEIYVIHKAGPQAAADPLIAALSKEESDRVVRLSLLSLGAIPSPTSAFNIVQDLLRFLHSPIAEIRWAALTSVFNQMRHLDSLESSAIFWVLLPMYADPSKLVRLTFSRFLRKIPSQWDSRCKALPPHPDDSYILSTTTWEELLLDAASIFCNAKNLSDIIYDLDQLSAIKDSNELPYAIMVLSEFCRNYEATLTDATDLLIGYASQDVTPNNTATIEASILGLRTIADFSPAAFKHILTKMTTPPIPNEGDLLCLLYLVDTIKEYAANKAPDLLRKFVPIVMSQRHTVKKRLYAIYMIVELAIISGPEEMVKALDAIQIFLDVIDDEQIAIKVYGSLHKILNKTPPGQGFKHPLFRTLLGSCRRDIRNKDANTRLRSLAIFKIFAKQMTQEESMWFVYLYLADSSPEVRKKAKDVMILNGVLDFLPSNPQLAQVNSTGGLRAAILDAGKLPSIQKPGVAMDATHNDNNGVVIPIPDDDPYNTKYYGSDRRRKFTKLYGLPDETFARRAEEFTYSILESMESRWQDRISSSPENLAKYQWKYPESAMELIEAMFTDIENATQDPTDNRDESFDVELEVHQLDVLSNLLFSLEGVSDKIQTYIERLQALVALCNDKATAIREGLYEDLENTFFFFNEYVDVPIVSEEQLQALEGYKSAAQEATLEIVKLGKTDKLSDIDVKRNELNEVVDVKSEHLRHLTILALHGTSGYSLYHALSTANVDAQVPPSIHFLAKMLENEHRGIRIAAVEALTTITRLQMETSVSPTFVNTIQEVISGFLAKLLDESSQNLYRRKADIINLIAHLLIYINHKEMRRQVVNLLVRLWRDHDSEVRVTAIKMMQLLGESGIPEVLEGFKTLSHRTSSLPGETAELPRSIMQGIAGLLSNPEYIEKDHLQNLLAWRFSQAQH